MYYTKEQLVNIKRDDLRKIARELKVSNVSNLKKEELVAAIIEKQEQKAVEEACNAALENATEVDAQVRETENERVVRKAKYVETAPIGSIVAFMVRDGKAKSAKIVKRSTPNRKLLVETSYGAQLKISYDDVIWVKTGTRFPRGVYNLLKGLGANEDAGE